MSFCRFSSDNFKCDVYCYESVDGDFVTHVAELKIVSKLPPSPMALLVHPPAPLPPKEDPYWDEMAEGLSAHQKAIESAVREKIGLPHDGQSFYDPTLADMLARLRMLKEMGYRIPAWVFASLQEEIDDVE